MANLPLSTVVSVSVAQAPVGAGAYNTSNIGLFTSEVPANSFGSLGYSIYLSPTQVGIDFGTNSVTYQEAVAIFSQQPNILLNGGYLVIMPFVNAVQHLVLSGVPASGTFELTLGGNTSAAINWNDTASAIQAKLVTAWTQVPGVVVSGSLASETLVISLDGLYGPQSLITVSSNSLETSGSVAITVTASTATAGETLAGAISRTQGLIQYFGILSTLIHSQADVLAAAAVVQTINGIALFASRTEADIQPGGTFDLLRTGTLTQSRGLYYGGATDLSALLFAAAYAGRGFSVVFTASLTTLTMNSKQLSGIQPDPSMTATIVNEAKTSGADIYVSLNGTPGVICNGANDYFDDQYNIQWFVGAIQVAEFNILQQTSTKLPQTEGGMSILKNGTRQVCEQALANGFIAPGSWTSSEFFGNQADLIANIAQRGYYIYSSPVALQLQSARVARQSPLQQVALKYAGAIQTASLLIIVNQ
jgi:hypothetical protein